MWSIARTEYQGQEFSSSPNPCLHDKPSLSPFLVSFNSFLSRKPETRKWKLIILPECWTGQGRTINQVAHTRSRDGTTDAGLIYSMCSVLPASRLNDVWTERALPSALLSHFLSPVSHIVVPRWATHPASSSQSASLQCVGLPAVVWTRVEFVCFSQVDIKMLLIRWSWLRLRVATI